MGLNRRSYSPAVVDKIVTANAESKSAATAQKMLRKLAETSVSVPQIMDVTAEIGQELSEQLLSYWAPACCPHGLAESGCTKRSSAAHRLPSMQRLNFGSK